VFGTPLAGAIFALEFIKIGKINYKALFTVFLSSILADLITKAWNIPHTHYVIDFVPALDIFTLIYILPAGIAFGLCAFLFSTSMHWTSGLYKKHISYAPFRPLIGGTVVALGVYFVGHTRFIGLGIPSIVSSFKVLLHPTDWFAKILFTVATLSAGFKGGEVTPLFYIGATLGNALSYIIPLPTALLAGMGFVAVFAGATNTPLACIIMAIELFGVECGVYAALACVIAYGVSAYTSIYTSQLIGITKNGIRVGDNIRIKDLMK
jgi:H+/Cl- antiporter ClcA